MFAPRFTSRTRMERWWCWAFRLHGREQGLDTSNVLAEGRSTPRAFLFFLCEDSRRSPRLNSRVNMFLPDAISGMRECFSGAYQLFWAISKHFCRKLMTH